MVRMEPAKEDKVVDAVEICVPYQCAYRIVLPSMSFLCSLELRNNCLHIPFSNKLKV